MIKIPLRYSYGFSNIIRRIDYNNEVPGALDPCSPNLWVRILIPDLHQWIEDNNIKYSLEEPAYFKEPHNNIDYYIIFENNIDAMLFKLTWL